MADKNLRVNLIANTSGFKSAMSESSNQIKLLNSEFKNAAAETDKYGNKVDSTGAKQKQLTGIIEQYKNRITAIKNEQRHWTAELEKGNITEEQHAQKQQELARRLNNTEGEMKKYEGQLKRLNAEGKNTTKTYAEFDAQFRDVGRTMRNVGATVGIAAGVGFTAMKRVLSGVVEEAMGFEHQMAEVKAISGATAEQFEEMSGQAKELGRQTIYTAEQVGEAQAGLARSGFETNEIMDAMPGLLDLAASSNMELGRASDITANILRGFNKDATESGRVADILAKGAATANTDVEGLGNSMEVVAPVASTLNVEFEDLAAATGIMADNGIEGSKAGRMLRQGMLRLAKPTGEAGDLIEELGINVFDSEGNMRSMDKVVGELEKGLKGQSKQAKAAALATIFGSESTAGWSALLDEGSGSLKNYITELQNSEGAAADMAETMQDTAQGAITRMQSALSGLKIELGEALLPYLVEGADKVSEFADKLENMDEATVETIAETALLITAVLGVTTAVAGLVTGIGALMAFAGPVGAAIVGGTALFGGLAVAIRTNIKRTEQLAEEQKQAKEDALAYGEGLSEGTMKGVKGYKDLLDEAKIKMGELKHMSGEEAAKTVQEINDAFGELGDMVEAELESQKETITTAITQVFKAAGEEGQKQAEEINKSIVESIDEDIKAHSDAIKTIIETQEEYGTSTSEMPRKIREAYLEALDEVDEGMKVFAKSQDEMDSIMEAVSENKGRISNEAAERHLKNLKKSYDESINAAVDWRDEHLEAIEQAHAQGHFEDEKHYEQSKAMLEASFQEMLLMTQENNRKSIEEIAGHLDDRGRLIDLATGEELEREKIAYEDHRGIMRSREETDEEYLQRWKDTNEEYLNSTEETYARTKEALEGFFYDYRIAMGDTETEAAESAKRLTENVLSELDEGSEQAGESGKKKSKAHKEGIESELEGNKQASKSIADGSNNELGKGNPEANKHGKDKGESHRLGLESTKSGNRSTSTSIVDTVFFELAKGKDTSENAGRDKGKAHEFGLFNTLGGNQRAGSQVSQSASSELGKTTDEGGGAKAGNMFMQGILSQRSGTRTAGVNVATSGKEGLSSVDTSSAGTGFVSGFSSTISSSAGSGSSVWSAAWSLGKSALNALKQSIDSHSPSKETEKEGYNFTDGFNIAVQDGTEETTKTVSQLATDSVTELAKSFDKTNDDTNKAMIRLKKRIKKITIDSNKEIKSINKKANADIQKIQKKNEKGSAKEIKKIREQAAKDVEQVEKDKVRKIDEVNADEFKKSKEWIDYKKKYQGASLAEELADWERVQRRYKKGTKEREDAEKNVLRVREQIYNDLQQAGNDYLKNVEDLNQKLIDEEKKLTEEYEKAVDQRAKTIEGFYGLFDEVKHDKFFSSNELIHNLEDQVGALESWSENLQVLAKRGIDEGLLAELQEMGIKSSGEINALVKMTDEELEHFQMLWKEKSTLSREQAVHELQGMKEDTKLKIEELRRQSEEQLIEYQEDFLQQIYEIRDGTEGEFNVMKATLPQIGTDAVSGMIQGMEDMRGPLMAKARSLANAVRAEMQAALDIHSPSRVMEKDVGHQIPAGVGVGIEDNIIAVKRAMAKMKSAFTMETNAFKQDFGKLALSLDHNKDKLVVEHEVKHSGLESKLDKLLDLLAAREVSGRGNEKPQIHQENHYHGNAPLSPSESARKNKQMLRQAAIEW